MTLSNAITALVADPSPETWERFAAILVRSQLGVVALGLPSGTTGAFQTNRAHPVGLGRTKAGGMVLILTCADPEVFRVRYPTQKFNAQTDAQSVFDTVLANPDCEGMLVNSAETAHSVPVTRVQIERLRTT